MKIVVLKEKDAHENRVSLTPESTKTLIKMGHTVFVEDQAGVKAGFDNALYANAGATVCPYGEDMFTDAHITLCLNAPSTQDIAYIPPHSTLIGMLKPHLNTQYMKDYAQQKITSLSLELMPRITRAQSMDILSSQSNLAGYRAVIEASALLNRAFPMMMTAAGTITPAKVLVIGAGVAGLQAIATARRLGAVVSAFDVRPAAKEQVQSLGATFVEVPSTETGEAQGGYAKEMSAEYKKAQNAKLREVITTQDIVITTALIPMKKAPVIIDADMVASMKAGSIILDLAAEAGGNCALTQAHETVHADHRVYIQDASRLIQKVAYDASQLYSRNVVNLIKGLVKEDAFDTEDEIFKSIALTTNGTYHRAQDFLQQAEPAGA